ncbi:tetratricopeptide repeat protein [Psychrobacter vallis]|uniref:tetratricopeptide repeat protein n=1 Tax=Psychrobacter vallis TaxID=248451 RepID=UPI00191B7E9C|nr:tetratricopeptide repeat protein [Psychrobacter vallis]
MSASPQTPLDYIAAGYWQDFLAERPIAGGTAYEAELRDCILDESLVSLQRVDTLLSQIRRDMIKVGRWDEEALLVDERYRNFMMFLAFYAGRVLARQWQQSPHWYGQFELRKRYPELLLTTDDFYQHMAVGYRDEGYPDANDNYSDVDRASALFFALEPIGLRLFGHIDRPFAAVQGGQIGSGLYQAVNARLPNANNHRVSGSATENVIQNNSSSNSQNVDVAEQVNLPVSRRIDAQSTIDSQSSVAKMTASNSYNHSLADSRLSQQEHLLKPDLSKPKRDILIKPEPSKNEPLPSISTPEIPPLTKPAPTAQISPTPDMFTQLLTELDEIEVIQTAGDADYQKAREVLDQFEQYVTKRNKPRAQIVFSANHLAAKKQALLVLQESANAGNTAAMLRLAMYELLGEGLTADKMAGTESGVEWVKQAASKEDSRAQRLLSKMYYQGLGVTQDIDSGKYWLTQAAENGHAEAADLVAQWQQAQALITTKNQEQHSIKRYQILLGIVGVIAILIVILV